MHKLNILIYGPEEFTQTINELRPYLKFNLNFFEENLFELSTKNYDGLIVHDQMVNKNISKNLINKVEYFKILATNQIKKNVKFDYILKLPTTIEEINEETGESKVLEPENNPEQLVAGTLKNENNELI